MQLFNELKNEYSFETFFKSKTFMVLLCMLIMFLFGFTKAISSIKILSAIISIVQIGAVVCVALLCLNIIKIKGMFIKILPIILSLVLISPYFNTYNSNIQSNTNYEQTIPTKEPNTNITHTTSAKRVQTSIATTTTKHTTTTTIQTTNNNSISMPWASYHYEGSNYKKVIKELKEIGFKNIKIKVAYDLSTGWLDSARRFDVKKISINNKTDFEDGDKFNKNAKVVVTYRDFEMNNPNIEFVSYTVDALLNDLESNPMRAEKTHYEEYVKLTGTVQEISKNGDYLLLHSSKYALKLDMIYCEILTDKQEELLFDLSVGDTVTIKGKITSVDTVYPYNLDVYSFS